MFITLEGVDGSGKTTQAKLLAEALGEGTVTIREPGGTEAAERVRELLADPGLPLDPTAELLLFCAARADLIARVIRPALERGSSVVCDRFSDSTVAYQGVARGLGIETAASLTEVATGGLTPDLTLLLRLDPETGLSRTEGGDRFESEGVELQRTVARAYDELARAEPERIRVIDASGTVEQVHADVMAAVEAARR